MPPLSAFAARGVSPRFVTVVPGAFPVMRRYASAPGHLGFMHQGCEAGNLLSQSMQVHSWYFWARLAAYRPFRNRYQARSCQAAFASAPSWISTRSSAGKLFRRVSIRLRSGSGISRSTVWNVPYLNSDSRLSNLLTRIVSVAGTSVPRGSFRKSALSSSSVRAASALGGAIRVSATVRRHSGSSPAMKAANGSTSRVSVSGMKPPCDSVPQGGVFCKSPSRLSSRDAILWLCPGLSLSSHSIDS